MTAGDNYQIGNDAPPVTGAPDAGEVERRRQMGGSDNPHELAAEIAAGNSISDTLAGLRYPANRKDVLDFLYLRRERTPNIEVVLKAAQLLPADKEYADASEIAAELGNINEEYNRSNVRK